MNLSCHLCGKRFRTAIAEARHRHNAQAVCTGYPRQPRTFADGLAEALKAKRDKP